MRLRDIPIAKEVLDKPSIWQSDSVVIYHGNPVCAWLHQTQKQIVWWIALHMAVKYYGKREDLALHLLDASGYNVQCPRHPIGHMITRVAPPYEKQSNRGHQDIMYYTLGAYDADIWDESGKLNEMWDNERNTELFTILYSCFPKANMSTVSPIVKATGCDFMNIDDLPAHDHKGHFDVAFGSVFNPDAVICDLEMSAA